MSSPPPSPMQQGNLSDAELSSDVERLFNYDPSQGAALALALVFLVIAAVQFYLYWKHRPDGYMLVIALTALVGESLGYALRIVAMHNPTIGTYIITTLLILLAPCATALVNYIVCGRVLAFTGQSVGCLRPAWISRAFLASDVITFLVQGFGGALMTSSSANAVTVGKDVVTAGLSLQIASFCLFVYVALNIQFVPRYGFRDNRQVQHIFWAMHATMACFIVRTVYRLVEFNGGSTGYASTHEWTFYVFDAAFMIIAFIIYSWPPLHFGANINKLSEQQSAAAALDAESPAAVTKEVSLGSMAPLPLPLQQV